MNCSNYSVSALSFDSSQVMNVLPENRVSAGEHICKKMESMVAGAVALQQLTQLAVDHGTRSVSAGVTLAVGLGYLSSGSFVKGGLTTAVGLSEAINVWRAMNPKNDIASLLSDANAGIGMIKTLEEANNQSFTVVDSNLEIIRKNIKKMNAQMVKIKSIAVEGQNEIKKLKQEASDLYKEAEEEFQTAKQLFKKSQSKFKQANKIYTNASKRFNDLFQLAQTTDITDKKKVDSFVVIAKEIQAQCYLAQSMIEKGNESINVGTFSLDEAREKELEAQEKAFVAMEKARSKLALIEVKAQAKKEYEAKIDETKEELDNIKARNQDVKLLLNEISEDLKEAKKLNEDKFGTMSICLGVIPGAVAGFTAGGMTGAFLGGMGGGTVVHNRSKIDVLVNGVPVYLDANPTLAERVKVKFSSRPSGWFNRFVRQLTQSFTVGVVDIQVGGKIVTLPFDLNKRSPFSKSDIFDLQQNLCKQVLSGETTARECLEILNELETKWIDRGHKHPILKGLIQRGNPYFAELKRACARIAECEQKEESEIIAEAFVVDENLGEGFVFVENATLYGEYETNCPFATEVMIVQ